MPLPKPKVTLTKRENPSHPSLLSQDSAGWGSDLVVLGEAVVAVVAVDVTMVVARMQMRSDVGDAASSCQVLESSSASPADKLPEASEWPASQRAL